MALSLTNRAETRLTEALILVQDSTIMKTVSKRCFTQELELSFLSQREDSQKDLMLDLVNIIIKRHLGPSVK